MQFCLSHHNMIKGSFPSITGSTKQGILSSFPLAVKTWRKGLTRQDNVVQVDVDQQKKRNNNIMGNNRFYDPFRDVGYYCLEDSIEDLLLDHEQDVTFTL